MQVSVKTANVTRHAHN